MNFSVLKYFILISTILISFSSQQDTDEKTGATSSASSGSNNIVFDLADLTVDYATNTGTISLEAFKSSLNDLIIASKDASTYGQLNWLSIGFPTLVQTSVNNTYKTLFVFRPEGFYASCDMLTDYQRSLFQDVVYRKYQINITKNQIVNLVPAKFECSMSFYGENSVKYLIKGRVTQLNTSPLRIKFDAPISSTERLAFERRFNKDGKKLDLDVNCDIYSQGQVYRQNTLIITGKIGY